jgi:hypothetical protein
MRVLAFVAITTRLTALKEAAERVFGITLVCAFAGAFGAAALTFASGLGVDSTCTFLGSGRSSNLFCFLGSSGVGDLVRKLATVAAFALAAVPELEANVLAASPTSWKASWFVLFIDAFLVL